MDELENGNNEIRPEEFFYESYIGVHRRIHRGELDFPPLAD